MSSQEVVTGVPGQLSAVLPTPGVFGVPERQEAFSDLGGVSHQDHVINGKVSSAIPNQQNSYEPTNR